MEKLPVSIRIKKELDFCTDNLEIGIQVVFRDREAKKKFALIDGDKITEVAEGGLIPFVFKARISKDVLEQNNVIPDVVIETYTYGELQNNKTIKVRNG